MMILVLLLLQERSLVELLSNSTREMVDEGAYVITEVKLRRRGKPALVVRQSHLETGVTRSTLTETRVIPASSIVKIETRVDPNIDHPRNTYLIITYQPETDSSFAYRDPGSGAQQNLTAVLLGPYRPDVADQGVKQLEVFRESSR